MKKMKKVLAGLLTATMVMSMSVTAFADTDTYTDMSTVTVKKTYTLANSDTISPAETFTFTELTCTKVTDAADGVTKGNAPTPTISSVSYTAGEAGSNTATKDITITLPTYTSVGIYTYTFSENNNGTAGVTYYSSPITLTVTVVEQEGKVRVAAVHTEGEGETKSNAFNNKYSAGSLTVTKSVTGILGDKTKEFIVKVTFNSTNEVKENITFEGNGTVYTKDGDTYTAVTGNVAVGASPENSWTGNKEVYIGVSDSEYITFNNIPYNVTYAVAENNYSTDGYDNPDYTTYDGIINSASDSVTITNNKGGTPDTGIILDSAPYVLLLALAGLGAFAVVSKKREEEF